MKCPNHSQLDLTMNASSALEEISTGNACHRLDCPEGCAWRSKQLLDDFEDHILPLARIFLIAAASPGDLKQIGGDAGVGSPDDPDDGDPDDDPDDDPDGYDEPDDSDGGGDCTAPAVQSVLVCRVCSVPYEPDLPAGQGNPTQRAQRVERTCSLACLAKASGVELTTVRFPWGQTLRDLRE